MGLAAAEGVKQAPRLFTRLPGGYHTGRCCLDQASRRGEPRSSPLLLTTAPWPKGHLFTRPENSRMCVPSSKSWRPQKAHWATEEE